MSNISKVEKSSVIEFDWGSTDLETFWIDQKGHNIWHPFLQEMIKNQKHKFFLKHESQNFLYFNWEKPSGIHY